MPWRGRSPTPGRRRLQTPATPGLQPWPCACQTACRMHLRTPSSVRSARPRCASSHGTAYCASMFSQPPPLRTSVTSTSSRSHWSTWTIGVPGPRLSPELRPVIESTELGRSLPRRVASATAAEICLAHRGLVGPPGHPQLEGRHPGVLADGSLAGGGLIDVLGDDGQRLRRPGPGGFHRPRPPNRRAHIGWKVRGRRDDEPEDALLEAREHARPPYGNSIL